MLALRALLQAKIHSAKRHIYFVTDPKKKFIWCAQTLLSNPHHPSLRHKKIQGRENYWEISITMNYRAVYFLDHDTAFFVEAGKHEDIF